MQKLVEPTLADELRDVVEDGDRDIAERIHDMIVEKVKLSARYRKTSVDFHITEVPYNMNIGRTQHTDYDLYGINYNDNVFKILENLLRKDSLSFSRKRVSRNDTRRVVLGMHTKYKTVVVPDGYVVKVSWDKGSCAVC